MTDIKETQDIAHPPISKHLEPSILPIVHALEALFWEINKKFFVSALSKPVITVAPHLSRINCLGWCTTCRIWKDDQSDGYYEINISAEYLKRSFQDIFETLLHEMVHLLNLQEGKNDTSHSGLYHNKVFKQTAEAHGLIVYRTKDYGYNATYLSPESIKFIESLDKKDFDIYRGMVSCSADGENDAKRSSTRKYICPNPNCDVSVRATKDVNILCGDCKSLFVKVQ